MGPYSASDASFREARRIFASSLWIGVALIVAAIVVLGILTVVHWGTANSWAYLFFVALLTPFAVPLLLMTISERRSWAAAARGAPSETRTGRGLGISNTQGRQVVAYDDLAVRGTPGRTFLHLSLPHGFADGEVRGPVTIEIFRRTGKAKNVGGPVRVVAVDGQRVWWAGNVVESHERRPKTIQSNTSF